MRETGLYVGPETGMAATAQAEFLRRKMGAGPLAWLSAAVLTLAGRKVEAQPELPAEHVRFCRGLLRGLGFDPDTHLLSKHKSGALIVRDAKGEPQRSVSLKVLKKLQTDPRFLAGFGLEVSR